MNTSRTMGDLYKYLMNVVAPGVKIALSRGTAKYNDDAEWATDPHVRKNPAEDIRHITDCHVIVSLRETEDELSSVVTDKSIQQARAKIESAIGYLTVLHARLSIYSPYQEAPMSDV